VQPARGRFSNDEIRIDGRDKVSGHLQYTADIKRPNMLWAAYATSPYAHAKIVRIDSTAAKAVPGVRAVLTAADIGQRMWGRNLFDWPVLAWDRVRLIGDRIAAVAAETREAAEEAARLVEVEFEELPAVLDPLAALAPGAPLIHPDRSSYYHAAFAGKTPPELPHLNVQGISRAVKGEPDLGPIFSSAQRVFEHHFHTPRMHAGYIEPHATLVWIDDDGTVHVQTPNKAPYNLQRNLARTLQIPAERIVVEPSAIGGDFGGKGLTIDECPCYYLAKATGRPVRYVQRYSEELNNVATRHSARMTLRTAVDANGKFLAHDSKIVYDGGAFGGGKPGPLTVPGQNGYASVPYHVPNVHIESMSVYTNTIPGAHVRAPNDVQVFFAWESHVDMIAGALGIDPLELRLRNVIREGQTTLTNDAVKQPMGVAVLETLRAESRYGSARPAGRARGISLVCRHTGGGKTQLKIRLEADGTIHVLTGNVEQGGGQLTVAHRVVVSALAVKPERVTVRRGSTSEALQDPGTGGSRVTHIVGGAAQAGADALRAELEKRSGMVIRDDRFVAAGGRSEAFETVARGLCAAGPIEVTGAYDGTHDAHHEGDFCFSAYSIEVEVDRETGCVQITDVVVVIDVGEIVNPVGHQGQIDGGFIFGVGSSMMEELLLDENGKVTTLSLGEYKLPTIKDIPPFRSVLITENAGQGPHGTKAAGELTNTGVAPAIANAVYNAVGVRLTELPMTAERVYAKLKGAPA